MKTLLRSKTMNTLLRSKTRCASSSSSYDSLSMARKIENEGVPMKHAQVLSQRLLKYMETFELKFADEFVSVADFNLIKLSNDSEFEKVKAELDRSQHRLQSTLDSAVLNLRAEIDHIPSETRNYIEILGISQQETWESDKREILEKFALKNAEYKSLSLKLGQELGALKAKLLSTTKTIRKYSLASSTIPAMLLLSLYLHLGLK